MLCLFFDKQFTPHDSLMQQQRYFPVSIFKLVVMSFFTFGFYIFYVWYRNWDYIRQRDQLQTSSFWRSFFMVFTVFSLFGDINKQSKASGGRGIPACYLLATWFFLLLLIVAPYVAFYMSITSAAGQFYSLLVNYAGLISLIPMQYAINAMNEPSAVDGRLTALDGVIIFVCLLIWILMIYITFFQPQLLSNQGGLQMYKTLLQQYSQL